MHIQQHNANEHNKANYYVDAHMFEHGCRFMSATTTSSYAGGNGRRLTTFYKENVTGKG